MLDRTYSRIAEWIETNGYEVAGVFREIYLTAPGDDAGTLIEFQFPVKRA
jgi:effector-binding domain-containing protein